MASMRDKQGLPHYLYVADSACGLLKVGLTTCPRRRSVHLASEFRRQKGKMRRVFFCQPLEYGFHVELSVVHELRDINPAFRTNSREWFRGIRFETAKRILQEKVAAARRLKLGLQE
jgi:hypothetical protein